MKPVLQIQCRSDHIRQSLIMSNEDRNLLVRLAERDISIRLICGEVDVYDVRVQQLVRHSRYNAWLKAWQVPIRLVNFGRPITLV